MQDAAGWAAQRPGTGSASIVQQAAAGGRPCLHPLRSPSGRILTEDRPAHHPWQHGLYLGLNDIDGTGFWTEGLHADPHRRATDGQVRCRASRALGDGWEVDSDWCAADGRVLLRDRLAVRPGGDLHGWWCDLDWRLTAVGRRRLGRYDYGGLFLRMPVHPGVECSLLTSSGCRAQPEAEGGRFAWVALAINAPGEAPAGLAIIDHPSNPGHPAPWRIDGQFGIGPSPCRAGERILADGAEERWRYRVLAFDGLPDADRIASLARAWESPSTCSPPSPKPAPEPAS